MHLSLELDTRGDGDFLDITSRVAEKVKGSGVASGVVVVLVQGSTAALILNEYEPGLLEDLRALGNRLAPPSSTTVTTRPGRRRMPPPTSGPASSAFPLPSLFGRASSSLAPGSR